MARAPGAARRRAAAGRKASGSSGESVRKGTWAVEEDAVLLEHVRLHGPRDWSSIRSKGLLPRTGKSCRLRWVNKLRPNLKGCKFSPEEERVVLDLQAKFGNKWARIATYLPGRTDNDVKNFWSTRQKRLARLRRSPRPGRPSRNISAKKAAASSVASEFSRCFFPDQVPFEESFSSGQCRAATPSMDAENAAVIPYDQAGFQLDGLEGAFLPVEPATESQACSSDAAPLLGKTDNVDVDDFWSTSQKQSSTLLCTPLPGQSSRNCGATTVAASSLQPPPAVGSFLDPVPFEGSFSAGQCCAGTTCIGAQNSELVPYDQTGSQLFDFGGAQPTPPVALATDIQASSSNAASLWPPPLQLYQSPYPLIDFPGILGSGDMTLGFVSAGATYDFAYHQEQLPLMQSPQMAFPIFGMHDGVKIEPRGLPPDHFDDLPPDMFDSADQLPPASSPSRTISDLL